MKTIDIRRSVRTFEQREVESQKIEKILRAGMQAPSAGNQQPWEFVIVQDEKKKESISKMSPYAGPALNAPYIIIVCANQEKMRFPENMQQDLGACTQNLLLEAVEQGLATLWMSVYPQKERIQCIKESVKLPESIVPYSVVLVGYPNDKNANHFVDRFDVKKIHFEIY